MERSLSEQQIEFLCTTCTYTSVKIKKFAETKLVQNNLVFQYISNSITTTLYTTYTHTCQREPDVASFSMLLAPT